MSNDLATCVPIEPLAHLGHAVYELRDPRTDEVRYIGYSKHLGARYKAHLKDNSKNHKARWVSKLLRDGVEPLLRVLCFVQNASEAKRIEIAVIDLHRRRGARLTNSTRGGDGLVDPTDTVRAKISASLQGKCFLTEEGRKKISAAHIGNLYALGHTPSAETKEKLRIANTGKHMSEEAKVKIRAAVRGRVYSAEARANMSAAHRGKKNSPEAVAKMVATQAKLRKPWTAERRARQVESLKLAWARDPERRVKHAALMIKVHTGTKHTQEHKDKISAASKGRKQTPDRIEKTKAAWVIRKAKKKCV